MQDVQLKTQPVRRIHKFAHGAYVNVVIIEDFFIAGLLSVNEGHRSCLAKDETAHSSVLGSVIKEMHCNIVIDLLIDWDMERKISLFNWRSVP